MTGDADAHDIPAVPRPRTRVALALGSGGARGYAHIGVIQVLEERGYDIVTIAGSSMGALVGGLYAAGALDRYVAWATSLSQLDVIRLLDPSITAAGAIKAEKVFVKVRELLDGINIEDMSIPFTVVVADLMAGKEVWFQRGPADLAIRASIAIPTVITPVMINGRLLADGGLLNPVPIAPLSAARCDATIAVSLGGERTESTGSPLSESASIQPVEEWGDRFRRVASNWLDRDSIRAVTSRFERARDRLRPGDGAEDDVDEFEAQVAPPPELVSEALPSGLGKGDVLTQTMEVMQSMLIRYRLASYPPDVLIEVSKGACRTLDFHRAQEMIDLGRELAEKALDASGLSPTQ